MRNHRSPLTSIARRLRRDSTEPEHRLWYQLRNRGLLGFKFCRQVPIGPYVADFVCREAALIVELDGSQHVENAARDAERTRYLEAKGYRVIRFWNNECLGDIEGVLTAIVQALEGPSPGSLRSPPSPR